MTRDAGDAVLIGVHHADKMSVRVLVKISPVNHVNLFAFFQNHGVSIAKGREKYQHGLPDKNVRLNARSVPGMARRREEIRGVKRGQTTHQPADGNSVCARGQRLAINQIG